MAGRGLDFEATGFRLDVPAPVRAGLVQGTKAVRGKN
jgi:hypothetical protein